MPIELKVGETDGEMSTNLPDGQTTDVVWRLGVESPRVDISIDGVIKRAVQRGFRRRGAS